MRREREAVTLRLADAERRTRGVEQSEYAEQQRRLELQEELEETRRRTEAEVAHLRSRLAAANERAESLAREVDRASRVTAEALQRAESDRAALRRREELRPVGAEDGPGTEPAAALEAERREAAERIAALEDELAARIDVHREVTGQLDEVRSELERVAAVARDQMRAQAETEGAVSSLRETAVRLDEHVTALERQKGELQDALADANGRLAERTAELEHERARVATERAAAAEAIGELEIERARRIELERRAGQRRDEPAPGERDLARQARALLDEVLEVIGDLRRAVARDIGQLEQEVAERMLAGRRRIAGELEGLERRATELSGRVAGDGEQEPAAAPAPQAAVALPLDEDLERLREQLSGLLRRARDTEPAEAPGSLADDLSRAAARLREQAPPAAAGDDEPVPAPPHVGAVPLPVVPASQRPAGPWLAEAVVRLAAADPLAAARLVAGLLPVHGAVVSEELRYAVTVERLGTFGVTLARGAATVEPIERPAARTASAFHVEGSAAALAPLVAGGAGRRLPGVRVEGSRRRLRRVLRHLREPLQLADAAGSSVGLDPGLALAALAAAVDPAWTVGHDFTVAWLVDAPAQVWSVRVGVGPPRVVDGVPDGGATATIRLPRSALVGVLAGLALPEGAEATVSGAVHAVALLRGWFDRAQGLR